MRCFRLAALPLALSFLVSVAWGQQPAAHGAASGAGNAALQYWQAFALLPTLDKDEEQKTEDWKTTALDASAQKIIAASQSSLMYLHRAAKLDRCDWGLDYNDGISLLLPHLGKARSLVRLGALDARQKFEQGDAKAAMEDVVSMMRLARNIEHEPIMISVLVGYAIEDITIELAARYIPQFKADFALAGPTFKALPPGVTMDQMLGVEKKFMAEWIIRKVQEAEQEKPGSWRDVWKGVLEGSDASKQLRGVDSAEQVIKLTRDLLPVYDELGKLSQVSKDEFDRQYPDFKKKWEAANPLAALLLPAVDKFLDKERQLVARRAMLAAAIEIAQGGPDKVKQTHDPFGTGPFEYRATDKGFELQSKLTFKNEPVMLTVGPRNKE